ncbi:hypothetical protein GQ42DRAFT_91864 [Ramicandelaber brevisporus]|nr:hypothetical protein GQ42DRAFT_91864 [Ramicandelaber brevisporus]
MTYRELSSHSLFHGVNLCMVFALYFECVNGNSVCPFSGNYPLSFYITAPSSTTSCLPSLLPSSVEQHVRRRLNIYLASSATSMNIKRNID